MKYLVFILLSLLMVYGCGTDMKSSDPERGIFISNFEDLYYWNDSGNLVKGKGRDESYCAKVDADHEYTPTFKARFSDIKVKKPKQIIVNGWFKVQDLNATAKLVSCIDHNGTILQWNATSTEGVALKPGVWTMIETVIEIPADVPGDAKVVVYGLRTGSGEVLFDDLEIKIVD